MKPQRTSFDAQPDSSAPYEHPEHFTDLDGLRGLLALSVLALHYGINALVLRSTGGLLRGFSFQLSVDFFYLLSGYVLCHSLWLANRGALAFAIKRAFRLFPVHWLTTGILIAVAVVADRSIPFLRPLWPLYGTVTDLSLVGPLLGHATINAPARTIAWELFLPILAVALAGPLSRYVRPRPELFLLVLLVGASATAYYIAAGWRLEGLRALAALGAGACLYATARKRRILPPVSGHALLYCLVGGLFAIMMAARTVPTVAILFPWIGAAIVLVGTRTRSLLSSRPIAWLGRISYTLYMVHVPVLVLLALIFGSMNGLLAKLAAVALSLVAAEALTRWVERPGMSVGRNLVARLPHILRNRVRSTASEAV